jgi:hypothetical protein
MKSGEEPKQWYGLLSECCRLEPFRSRSGISLASAITKQRLSFQNKLQHIHLYLGKRSWQLLSRRSLNTHIGAKLNYILEA